MVLRYADLRQAEMRSRLEAWKAERRSHSRNSAQKNSQTREGHSDLRDVGAKRKANLNKANATRNQENNALASNLQDRRIQPRPRNSRTIKNAKLAPRENSKSPDDKKKNAKKTGYQKLQDGSVTEQNVKEWLGNGGKSRKPSSPVSPVERLSKSSSEASLSPSETQKYEERDAFKKNVFDPELEMQISRSLQDLAQVHDAQDALKQELEETKRQLVELNKARVRFENTAAENNSTPTKKERRSLSLYQSDSDSDSSFSSTFSSPCGGLQNPMIQSPLKDLSNADELVLPSLIKDPTRGKSLVSSTLTPERRSERLQEANSVNTDCESQVEDLRKVEDALKAVSKYQVQDVRQKARIQLHRRRKNYREASQRLARVVAEKAVTWADEFKSEHSRRLNAEREWWKQYQETHMELEHEKSEGSIRMTISKIKTLKAELASVKKENRELMELGEKEDLEGGLYADN
uniref:Uncharacterized protein n=1 Tax=Rhodosorus marinus TaxID=101924 RepID=A0A7S3EGR8_9RHOD|mmetsp:Transcript_32801/g.128844  ORF Transcript_32801/g.128844 Transcript_32801/m.128844 type:complete len:463 (+) Transcript_32801:226-1614(+)